MLFPALPLLTSFLFLAAGNFEPPNPQTRLSAVGDLRSIPLNIRPLFDAASSEFSEIQRPRPMDWLAAQSESGQTFDQFVASRPNRPSAQRYIIYFQPVGDFSETSGPSLQQLRDFTSAFFQKPVVILRPIEVLPSFRSRINPNSGNKQILTTDVLAFLKSRVPSDGYCVLAVTMEDLYPDPAWNYVFGEASLRDRVGIFSLVRYDPAFNGKPRTPATDILMFERSCKVLVHETGHMFGIAHCVHFSCVMNGSNHLAEADNQPLHCCPVCLRKLYWSIQFDPVNRYKSLERLSRESGMLMEAEWIQRNLKRIGIQTPP